MPSSASVDGILVPGGYGQRGSTGMVAAARWAREHKVPYFGICLGLQIMVIETSRNVLGWADADSTEFNPDSAHPVVSLLEEQVDVKSYGGTQRLGKSESVLKEGSLIRRIYGSGAHPRSGIATATRFPTPSAPTSRRRASRSRP